MRYGDFGAADQERLRLLEADRSLAEEAAALHLVSPIAGIVATPRLRDLNGAYFDEGAPVVELIDESAMRARIYIPEFAMHDIRVGAAVRLRAQSRLLPLTGVLGSVSVDWTPLDPSLDQKEQLAGIDPPRFYTAESWLDRAADLRPGMTGIAKIRVGRRTMASLAWRFIRDLVARRVW
jgi:hypothetical protein